MGASSDGLFSLTSIFCLLIILTNNIVSSDNWNEVLRSTTDVMTTVGPLSTSTSIDQSTSGSGRVKFVAKEMSTEMPVPGGKFTYQYTVTNIGRKMGRFNITASVDNYMLKACVTKSSFVLRPNKSHTGLINIDVNNKARPGLQRKIKIIITDDKGRAEHFKRFIVVREDTVNNDANPPEIIFLNFITTCKTPLKKHFSCGVGNWTVLFIVQDKGSGLSIIDVDDHRISSVWTENYSEDQVIRPINGKIRRNGYRARMECGRSFTVRMNQKTMKFVFDAFPQQTHHLCTDCCRKRTVIIVTDNNGNTIKIPVYFPTNSTIKSEHPTSHRAHSVKMTAVVVSVFAACLFIVIVVTVTIQHWKKIACHQRRKREATTFRLVQNNIKTVQTF